MCCGQCLGEMLDDRLVNIVNATVDFRQPDWVGAASYWRRSTDLAIRRSRRGLGTLGQSRTSDPEGEIKRSSDQFWALVKAAYRVALSKGEITEGSNQTFEDAQWAQRTASLA